jgi:hypothetical protein
MEEQNNPIFSPPKAGPAAEAGPAERTEGPALPPTMAAVRQHTVDELAAMINRVPLFMRTLDETDGQGGPNMALEAIRSLAYDGTRAEVADNFREQGNERARVRRWAAARGFYDKAIEALHGPQQQNGEIDVVLLDEQEETRKERQIEEACYVNRALCNLELRKPSIAGYLFRVVLKLTQRTTAPASMIARVCSR